MFRGFRVQSDADHSTPPVLGAADRRVVQRLTVAYISALAVIAILSCATHLILDHVITRQNDSAALINIAGRQRMLSQRIALLATDLQSEPGVAAELARLSDLMERSNRAICQGDDLGIHNKLSPEAHALYFDGPDAIDPQVKRYIGAARAALAASEPTQRSAAVKRLHDEARDGLLFALDHAVALFENEADARVHWLKQAQKFVLASLLTTLAAEALLIFRPMVMRIRQYTARLFEMATRDALTGLSNRRHFHAAALQQLALAQSKGRALAILCVDIDHFKKVNDNFGHEAGDRVLKRFAEVATRTLRNADVVGRTGGEEFSILLPDTDRSAASTLAERLRTSIADDRVPGLPPVTISIGITVFDAGDTSLDQLMRRADEALYAAKRNGRDRAVAVYAAS